MAGPERNSIGEPPVSAADLMRDIEDEVRRRRRKRLLARGGAPEYDDPAVYAEVDGLLRRALDARDHDALLLPELMDGDEDWRMATHLRFASHRPVLGPLIVGLKRRLLLPATRWLYEFALGNFRRQDRLNRVLFACIETLAIENARLRARLPSRHEGEKAETQEGKVEDSK